MSTLYIVGNGLDLAFGLPTSYKKNLKPLLPQDVRAALIDCGANWSDFEDSLGHLDLTKLCDNCFIENVYSDYLRSDPYYYLHNGNYHKGCRTFDEKFNYALGRIDFELHRALAIMVCKAQDYLKTNLNLIKNKCNISLFKSEDSILTFNYTGTIESVFNIPKNQILHLHGDGFRNWYKDSALHIEDRLIFGHSGNNIKDYILPANHENDNDIEATYMLLKKDYQLDKLMKFLSGAKRSQVIVLGHSMASVDSIYMETIEQVLMPEKWVVSYHKLKDEGFDSLRQYSFFQKMDRAPMSELLSLTDEP